MATNKLLQTALMVCLGPMLGLSSACDGGEDEGAADETGASGDGDTGDLCDPSQTSSGVFIGETQLDTAYPTPAGGTLIDGTWDLIRFEVYSPATADENTRAERLIIAGDSLVSIRSVNGDPNEIIGASVAVDGSELLLSVECPSAAEGVVPFTSTATELWLFDPSEPNIKVYAKQ